GNQVNDKHDDVQENKREGDCAAKTPTGRAECVYICGRDREDQCLRNQAGCVNQDTLPDMARPFELAKTTGSGNFDGEDLQSQGDGRQYMPSLMNDHKQQIGEAEIGPSLRVCMHKGADDQSAGGQRPVHEQLYTANLGQLEITRSLVHALTCAT